MKKLSLWMLAAILTFCGTLTFTSCSLEDNPIDNPEEPQVTEPFVTATIRYEEQRMTVYNIEYPSTDPFGKPVMLSGTISMGDEVNEEQPAMGLVLYNHYTVFRADECPTKGKLDVEKLMPGSRLITVSPDYYGFGCTEDKMQAYCISRVNAHAAVDALLAAKKLLPEMGIEWDDDVLYNVGYSQGGQTAMGVVRLIDEEYPDLHISSTVAGGGAYDIPETYRQFFETNVSGMPSTVISVLLTYNEYFGLNIPREEVFLDPPLSKIDEYVLSKQYTREEIDEMIGTQECRDICTPTMFDFSSDISRRYIAAMEQDNLCAGWTPRTDERIILVHHKKDITVPVANAVNLYQFLTEQGVSDITYYVADFGTFGDKPAHETAAALLAMQFLVRVCEDLKIAPWIDLSNINL